MTFYYNDNLIVRWFLKNKMQLKQNYFTNRIKNTLNFISWLQIHISTSCNGNSQFLLWHKIQFFFHLSHKTRVIILNYRMVLKLQVVHRSCQQIYSPSSPYFDWTIHCCRCSQHLEVDWSFALMERQICWCWLESLVTRFAMMLAVVAAVRYVPMDSERLHKNSETQHFKWEWSMDDRACVSVTQN